MIECLLSTFLCELGILESASVSELETSRNWVRIPVCLVLTVWLLASFLASPSLHYYICNLGIPFRVFAKIK